jgi:hypothetical protein
MEIMIWNQSVMEALLHVPNVNDVVEQVGAIGDVGI